MDDPNEAGKGLFRHDPTGTAVGATGSRQQVFEAACKLFSERGFVGTHIRDICQRAGVNIAAVCYHFRSKEELYEAVAKEARRRLAATPETLDAGSSKLTPQHRLAVVVESLFEKLSEDSAWIAKLLVRELLDPPGEFLVLVRAGLKRDFAVLEAAIRDLLVPRTDPGLVRLYTVSVMNQCVCYSLVGEELRRACPLPLRPLPDRKSLVEHIVGFSLGALRHERRKRNYGPGN